MKKKTRAAPTPQPKFWVRRVSAQIRIGGSGSGLNEDAVVLKSRLVLIDMTENEVDIFSSEPVALGTEVGLTLDGPRRFYVRGIVSMCRGSEHESRVISQEKFPYRLKIQFTFSNEEEKKQVRQFVGDAREPDYVRKLKKAA